MGKGLGDFEQLLLLALVRLPVDQAYGVPIREEVERRTGRALSSGAVYTALDRLADKGLVTSRMGEPTAERGGRRKRLYRITGPGLAALDAALDAVQRMARGIEPRLARLRNDLGAEGTR